MHRALLISLLLAAPVAALPAPSLAQTQAARVDARVAANSIAQLVEDNYFNAERGTEIANDVRGRATSGAFDRYTNPHDLATAIGAVLEPYDAHFDVRYGAPPQGQGAGVGPRPAPQAGQDPAARTNYGFRRVEMLPGRIGYIAIDQFANFDPGNANAPARAAADAAMALLSGAEAYIIDVRDNGGGSPVMVGYLSAYFTPEGADIFSTFYQRQGTRSEAPRVRPTVQPRLEAPLFILTSGRTGSAAEGFSYTLQSAGRAQTVGEASAGGANPGTFFQSPEGFTVFISLGSPRNPITGRNWEGTGVVPNVAISYSDALTRAHTLALEARLPALEGVARTEAEWILASLRGGGPEVSARDLRAYAGAYGDRTVTIDDGRVSVRYQRRPPLVLIPVERDLFYVQDRPLTRVRFDRDARGRIEAFTQLSPDGGQQRNLRTE